MNPIARSNDRATQPGSERRTHRRKGTFWRAQLVTSAGSFECRVLDLSLRGAKVQLDQPVAEAEAVTLILEPLTEFSGAVVWRGNGSVGIRIREHRTTKRLIVLPREACTP